MPRVQSGFEHFNAAHRQKLREESKIAGGKCLLVAKVRSVPMFDIHRLASQRVLAKRFIAEALNEVRPLIGRPYRSTPLAPLTRDDAAARAGRSIRCKTGTPNAGESVQSAAMSGNLNLLWRDTGASR
jgi:hypothetical protein